jgi:2-polyprenyl-3-methyl-5-hydroxy-6-metoxy-1,4-benzoquinol methylase
MHRAVTPEIMDGPGIDAAAHRQALAGLRRINRVSGAAEPILNSILELAKTSRVTRLSLLDVACGGGDVPVQIALAARTRGLTIDLTFLDRSVTAIQQATDTAKTAGLEFRTNQADTLNELSPLSFDVLTNSLFLHHLVEPENVVELLAQMRRVAARRVVISDLRRCRRGWVGAWIGCRVLSRSPIVHHDGPASVRAAWTVSELKGMAERAGMTGASIRSVRPWRMLLEWSNPAYP